MMRGVVADEGYLFSILNVSTIYFIQRLSAFIITIQQLHQLPASKTKK
jgi:hypothetical protein